MNKENDSPGDDRIEVLKYDFSRIDYELDRTRSIDTGAWSTVYFAKPVAHSTKPAGPSTSSPPGTPSGRSIDPACSLYVVKMTKGAGAKKVFGHEVKILTKLQQSEDSHEYIVPFYGVDERNSALVFEGVGRGPPEDPSLDGFVKRFTTMTEHERHKAFRELFVTAARDLVGGLKFIHAHGIVHADIKPANVLLDVQQTNSAQVRAIRARYIDFSASFCSGSDASHAGGTWDWMAPEQIYAYKEPPTFASDIWSLGITLLFILVGRSPYTETCGSDTFRIREAVKEGKPLQRARYDPAVTERMKSCQDLLDCCKLALQKDRDSRSSAATWEDWLEKR
jgi:serine/threonine protein kinase